MGARSTMRFRCVSEWGELPTGWERGEVPGVAVDDADRIYALVRANPPVRVYDRDGRALAAWGEGLFRRPHGISVAKSGAIYCVDDLGHAVHRFSPAGELELTLRRQGAEEEYDALVDPGRPETVTGVAPPFNYPTHAIEAPNGDIYVSDGYGNARVHVFTYGGQLTASWGAPGSKPGEFRIPHGLAQRDGALYVADRLNSRLQIFDAVGRFLDQWQARWPNNTAFDREGSAYVTELGSLFLFTHEADRSAERARVTIRSSEGRVEAELAGEGDDVYFAPHGIAVDGHGDVYVGEVGASYTHGHAPPDWPVLRKYVRM
jgi:DNA-binding beta-propeller fold protein YncE